MVCHSVTWLSIDFIIYSIVLYIIIIYLSYRQVIIVHYGASKIDIFMTLNGIINMAVTTKAGTGDQFFYAEKKDSGF